jgi:hypothetical protein
METPEAETVTGQKLTSLLGAALGILLVPVLVVCLCIAVPYILVLHWVKQHREHRFRTRMRSLGRLMTWNDFVRMMRENGGTCIEERFSPKGPVRFWWTPENVHGESPYQIIDWFTMRKGRQAEPFVHWCRGRYTDADAGGAVLVDTGLVAKRDIYALWSEYRSDSAVARWVEVAPPEILPWRPRAAT